MTRVLITNDDGISAPGLRYLAETAAQHGMDVVVAAPIEEASGSSAAMSAFTEDGKVIIERRTLPDLSDVPAYAVGASPSYIVVLAMLSSFGEPPDLVLSGINRGANAGRAVLHSGTVGAALTAATHNRPAMSVSLDVLASVAVETGGNALAVLSTADDEGRNWASAASYVREVLGILPELPAGTVVNLNVPDMPLNEIAGLHQATLAQFGQVQMAIAEHGSDFVRTATEQSRRDAEPGTDLALLADGCATLTVIRPVSEAREVTVPLPSLVGREDFAPEAIVESAWYVPLDETAKQAQLGLNGGKKRDRKAKRRSRKQREADARKAEADDAQRSQAAGETRAVARATVRTKSSRP